MFNGCPLCNGIELPGLCPTCSAPLKDLGMIEDYFGPYSPYQDDDIIEMEHINAKLPPSICIHLVHCPNCLYDHRVKVKYSNNNS